MIKYIARAMKRQVANRIAYIVIAVIIALVPALIGGHSANAASAKDDWFRQAPELVTGQTGYGGYTCELEDRSQDWYTTALNADWGARETDKESLQNAINEDGRWTVSQQIEHYQNNPAYAYTIIWTEDDSLALDWNATTSVRAMSTSAKEILIRTKTHHLSHSPPQGCNEFIGISPGADNFVISNKEITTGTSRNNILNHFAYVDEEKLNLPDGYEGVLPQQTPPGSKQTIKPTISATITDKTVVFKLDPLPFEPCRVNYMVSYSTKNNHDYGETVIETLKNGWTQIFSGDLDLNEWRKGSQQYDAEVMDFIYRANPNDEQIVTAPNNGSIMVFIGVETDWGGAPHKPCGDNGNPDDFEYEVDYRLQFINIDGSNYVIDGTQCDPASNICDTTTAKSDLMDCFTDSFPFISIDDCKKAVGVVVERLSFNRLQFGNSWIYSPQCEKLGVLGDWIHAEDRVICPYFPAYVRNTVDPFITFILGLLVVTYVARSSARDF